MVHRSNCRCCPRSLSASELTCLLQHFVAQMDATWALHRLLLDDAGRLRADLSSKDKLQVR